MLSVTLFTVASNGNNPHTHQDVGGQTDRLHAHVFVLSDDRAAHNSHCGDDSQSHGELRKLT